VVSGYDVKGRDAWLEAVKAQNGPFEVRQELSLIAETENTVVAEWTWSIPHTDGSGRWVTLPGLSYFVFDEGRIAKLRQYCDLAAFLAEFQEDAPAAGN
jgi:hypothetical protein